MFMFFLTNALSNGGFGTLQVTSDQRQPPSINRQEISYDRYYICTYFARAILFGVADGCAIRGFSRCPLVKIDTLEKKQQEISPHYGEESSGGI